MADLVEVRGPHAADGQVHDAVYAWHQGDERIPDAVAAAIASHWASPGGSGEGLASLATGFPRERAEIRESVEATLGEVERDVLPLTGKPSPSGWGHYDVLQLNALLGWVGQG